MSSPSQNDAPLRVLLYTRTTNYPHESIPQGVRTIEELGRENGFEVVLSIEEGPFRDELLDPFHVIAFLNNSGDILDEKGKESLQRYVRSGRGIVGIHGAAATMEQWPWYVGLMGGTFKSHPEVQRGRVITLDRRHPATSHLPEIWECEEEWYNFASLAPNLRVLLRVDEGSYKGGEQGEMHPVAWTHLYEGSRVFYTAFGHLASAFTDPRIRKHLLGGILWAAGRREV